MDDEKHDKSSAHDDDEKINLPVSPAIKCEGEGSSLYQVSLDLLLQSSSQLLTHLTTSLPQGSTARQDIPLLRGFIYKVAKAFAINDIKWPIVQCTHNYKSIIDLLFLRLGVASKLTHGSLTRTCYDEDDDDDDDGMR